MLSKSITTGKYFWNGKAISESEYNNILLLIRDKPVALEGYDYRLTDALEWELYERPIEEEAEEALSEIEQKA